MRFVLLAFGCAVFAALGCGNADPHLPGAKSDNASGGNSAPRGMNDVSKSDPATKVVESLEGTWGIVSAEREGEPLVLPRASLRQTYEGDRVRFGSPPRMAENEFTIDPLADPPRHDVGSGNRVEQGIYRLDGDVLTICSAPPPHSRPDDFMTRPGDGRSMMVFRRMHMDKLDQPVTKAEADAFSQRIEQAAKDGDAGSLNAVIDLEGMLDRITQGLGIPENKRLNFLYGLKSNSQALSGGPTSLGAQIVAVVGDGGLYRVLRVTSDAKGWRVLCRLVPAQGGLNYQEFILGRDAFGNTVATDVFLFASGDLLSAMQLRALLPSLAKTSPTVLQQLPASDRDYIQSGDPLREYVVTLNAGEFDAAEEIYQGLPPSVRSETWLLLGRLNKARKADRSRILQECLQQHPEEPAFELFAIEDAINRADKDEAVAIIERLELRVGIDPYLNLLRAKACENAGDLEESRRLTELATAAEPELRQLVERAANPK